MKLGDRAIAGGTAIMVLGGIYVLLFTRREALEGMKEAQRQQDIKWDGGIAYLKPRPGTRRRLA